MTLDDLIARLEEIKRACPAAGSATVLRPSGVDLADVKYEGGAILIGAPPPRMPWTR